MGIMADFGDLLPHTITWERLVSHDSYGTPTYDAPISFKARVDFARRGFVGSQGELIGTTGSIVVGGTPVIRPEDRITLPDGSQPPILYAYVTDDFEGIPYVTMVTLG